MTGTSITEKSGTLNYTLKVPAGTHKSRNEYYATPAALNAYKPEVGTVNIPLISLYPCPTLVSTASKMKVSPSTSDLKFFE
jgi:hypothetical protein